MATRKKWPPEFTVMIRERCIRCETVQECHRKWLGITQGLPFCIDGVACGSRRIAATTAARKA